MFMPRGSRARPETLKGGAGGQGWGVHLGSPLLRCLLCWAAMDCFLWGPGPELLHLALPLTALRPLLERQKNSNIKPDPSLPFT